MEIFDTLILMAATQLYLFNKIHRTIHVKESEFY